MEEREEKTVQEYMEIMEDHKKLVSKQMKAAKRLFSKRDYRQFVRKKVK